MAERIVEMAYSRADAMEMCSSLGKQFVSHFRKIYDTGINARDFNHHCSKMQAWYDKVCESKLKTSKLPLNIEQIVGWFLPVELYLNTFSRTTITKIWLIYITNSSSTLLRSVI